MLKQRQQQTQRHSGSLKVATNLTKDTEMLDSSGLIETAVRQGAGFLSKDGALMVNTGQSTGRSPKERFVVRRPEVDDKIDWGNVNQEIGVAEGEAFFHRVDDYLQNDATCSMSGYVGCFSVKVRSTSTWHIAFARNMFRDKKIASLDRQVNESHEIEILHVPFKTPQELGIEFPYSKGIIVDPAKLRVAIVGTAYAGEIKKSAFSLCNYLFPQYGIMPMHSSANCELDGSQSSVLFGLSGTGKTTLSADPERFLIGDDEIVWSTNGLSNLEGGCYAKLINLDKNHEPDIYRAANRFGSILENVKFHPVSREIDFFSDSVTENTRASYSIDCLDKVFDQNQEAKPPRSIVFLTADAFGALPAVARLNEWQAQYHFISGYTAKVAGTEIGVTEPEATFSACFGAPFMPLPASVYGRLLASLIREHNVPVYMLNTGWVNGYGQGERFPIPVSRRLLKAIQSGELESAEMVKHPVFGFEVPKMVKGVDEKYLSIPEGDAVRSLAEAFIKNADSKPSAFTDEVSVKGGPLL